MSSERQVTWSNSEPHRIKRFRDAYLMMARKARYRPKAPGDGMGSVYLTKAEASEPTRLGA